ncbi:MAG: phosphate/phosphite/phosphonate ABC transporter substrate-binding protein [Campylobacteraceae bacterium]|nr:phosphate/phosphite/phosphonate ABC transporter substrate-binding protein [Campylobacteraceae bacterium]
MKRVFYLFLIFGISAFAVELTLGVVPQQSPLKLSNKWKKITQYLHDETGIKVIFKTQRSIPSFEKVLYSGGYDIAYMNPYHFIVANKQQNYEAFTRANKQIEGILLSKDKNFKVDKNYLKDKTFLFPAPNAFAATLLTKYELRKLYNFNVDKDAKVLYVNSHDSVYKGVAREVGDIGGGIVRTYNNFIDKNDKEKISIVYKTNAYPSHPIAAHPRVNNEIVKKLQDAFLNMPNDLKKILSIKKFIKTDSKEYEVIKEVKSN